MKCGEKLSREQQNLIGEPNKGCKAATFVGELILASPTSGIPAPPHLYLNIIKVLHPKTNLVAKESWLQK